MKIKFLLLSLCLIVCISNTKAQQWSPPGAKWGYQSIDWGAWYYHTLTYVNDTIINNIPAKQLDYSFLTCYYPGVADTFSTFVRYEYLYESNDTVYWLNSGNFEPLYVFSAQVGEKWEINKSATHKNYPCDSLITSDSVVVTNISSFNQIKILEVESVNQHWQIGRLYDGIGADVPFPKIVYNDSICSVIDGAIGTITNLTCYYDSIRGYINFYSSGDCLFLTNTERINNSNLSGLHLYPNPANNTLHIEFPTHSTIRRLLIFDITGRVVYSDDSFKNDRLDISFLEKGIYILKIRDEKGKNYQGKIMKL